jgi:5S rRNA maturation endonuclease (ribonuclease M5)
MDYLEFFKHFVTIPENKIDENGNVMVYGFRPEEKPSLSINVNDGRFKDFGDDSFAGDAFEWIISLMEVDFTVAKIWLDGFFKTGKVITPIDFGEVRSCMKNLTPALKNYLLKDRKLTEQAIKEYRIGWSPNDNRYTIPVFGSNGMCLNMRMYSRTSKCKMLPYDEGYGYTRLYPLQNYHERETTVLIEGEWDALVLRANNINSLTSTGGAGSWKTEWNSFVSKDVIICYDNDDAGRKGAKKVARKLKFAGKKVRIATLPEGMDVTDYFQEHDVTEFQQILDASKEFEDDEVVEGAATKIPLYEATKPKFRNKEVAFECRVVGKDTSPYNIPLVVDFKCANTGIKTKRCDSCALCDDDEVTLKLAVNPKMLEFIKVSKSAQRNAICGMKGVNVKCNFLIYSIAESINIEEILLAPEMVANSSDTFRYDLVPAFYAGPQVTEATKSYMFQGKMTPDPWNQKVTFLLKKCVPLKESLETFKVTPSIIEELKVFQPTENQSLKEKFREIHEDFEKVTNIIGRDDLLTGIDLAYHSCLDFNFLNYPVQKGWVDMIVIGDTRTGKTETIQAMLNFFQLGEMSTAENTSFAGLVGGLQQMGDKKWFITWGKIPQNDRKLFVIDEITGLATEDIGRMSGLRSSGIAEVVKIHTEKTFARTRLIWLSNPRGKYSLGDFAYGVEALEPLIGQPEDIARFDFAISAAAEDIPLEDINKRRERSTDFTYTADLCKTLILWSWSRKSEHIKFTKEAENIILAYATTQGRFYSNKIPLVEGANQRIKLAKLAVATACRTFSTSDGKDVVVTKEHVEFAYDFLEHIYSKSSFDYTGFSNKENKYKKAAVKEIAHVKKIIRSSGIAKYLDKPWVSWRSIEEQTADIGITACLRKLVAAKMLEEKSPGKYYKTKILNQILKEEEEAFSNDATAFK